MLLRCNKNYINKRFNKLHKILSKMFATKDEEVKVEVNVKIREDIFDKKHIIEEDNNYFNPNQFANLNDNSIENSTLDQLLLMLKSMVKYKNTNFDTWYKAINKFNDFLCNHLVSKEDIIDFLEVLNFFQPKILEKKTISKDLTDIDSKVSFSSRHEEEYYRLTQPKDVLIQFALFLKKNFKPHLFLELAKEATESKIKNFENVDEGLEDLLGIYDVLFRNIEMKIIDDIKNGRVSYSYSECIKIIAAFSRASEGTNLLYEVLMRKVAKNGDKLTIPEIEVIINYLPHDLYNNNLNVNKMEEFKYYEKEVDKDGKDVKSKYSENGRTAEISEFYKVIFEKIINIIQQLDDTKFINLFQGVLKIKFVDVNIISAFLNNFDLRINKQEKDKKFYFEVLQLLAYFFKIENNKKLLSHFDMELFFKSLREPFINKYMGSFDLKEIATIFWINFHLEILNLEKIKLFETPIKNILLGYINDPKSKIDSMGYETHTRYYNNYGIDQYDLETINFFIRINNEYKGELLELMKKALKCIELENTHPISRKWYHF